MPEPADRTRAYVLPRLREIMVKGRGIIGSATSPEQLLTRFLEFDESGRQLLRQEFPDRVIHDQFDTDLGKRLRAGSVERGALSRSVLNDVADKISTLEDLVGRLEHGRPAAFEEASRGLAESALERRLQIFVVHGQNDAVKTHVQLVLGRALPGANVIVLHEQPSGGSRTIIEKLERYAEGVDFAVVLLTGDDQLALPDGRVERRARQNVLLELGYFLAKLGREKVVALHETGLTLPSDFSGVIYISYGSDGRWRSELLKELQAAGLSVNWAEAMK